ncbi:alkaline phosphatase family protein [uncultured Thiodictyon sp.]|uniref:alkaline phosphatase family protein n=1 Tax=uncultured Thiodictyon sp. TaxID=1846217 RepID=UPI0025DC998C|nr:alkaline phosphatase family protein [uncultured Thiodictyon sp.]
MRASWPLARLFAAALILTPSAASLAAAPDETAATLRKINHFVIIYQENHSFDNLYGGWEGVAGLASADPTHRLQVNQAGAAFDCLHQVDVNLSSPPQPVTCTDAANGIASAFTNAPFRIEAWIGAADRTCPGPDTRTHHGVPKGEGRPGGCTADLMHRFYQEQYQLDGGRMDRYVAGSDATGLTMGHYDTKQLPIYRYLHGPSHPPYAIADHFFQAAFGGSFLNHQWLIAAATPVFTGALSDGSAADPHSLVDAAGMPSEAPLYRPSGPVKDAPLTVQCPAPVAGLACGDFAVNTIQPAAQPYRPNTPAGQRLPALSHRTIGDSLSAAGIDWAWYAGGWSNANGDLGAAGWTNGNGPQCTDPGADPAATFPHCPDRLFQYHHQPFNYFAAYAQGTPARAAHLRDEQAFIALAQTPGDACQLKPVSFVKPGGADNEHPGYASEAAGGEHLVKLLRAVADGPCAKDTMVIVTYDEFGGQWDHVPPPGQGDTPGPHDQWGPGTRIPALIVAPFLAADQVVDRTPHDTTSILATIEHRFGLAPLGPRDAAVADLATVFAAH